MFFRVLFTLVFVFTVPLVVSAQKGLSRKQADKYTVLALKKVYEAHSPVTATEWRDKLIVRDTLSMRFEYKVFGEKPADGRSLYISLHGGGNTPPAVNDQQWRNQQNLYKPAEGVYVAPRAPTNTWNLWHEDHIDDMIDELILDAVIAEGVNPDKVYLMGYSAGGDGTFQLAPRMADRFAAAAMMAGHPGDAPVENLRNLPFSLFVGGRDAAYNRNGLVAQWGHTLDTLQQHDPKGYVHDLHVYEELGHWMEHKDTIAVSWMAKYRRNPLPTKVVWKQDDRLHNSFYWLSVDHPEKGKEVIASIDGNTITVEKNDYTGLTIYLNDQLVDLDKEVIINYRGNKIYAGKITRSRFIIDQTVENRKDPGYIFSARCILKN